MTLSLMLTAMVAAYSSLSTSHLRHWGRKKDPTAKKLYPLKAEGSATLLTLELFRALSLSASVIVLSGLLSPVWAWLSASVAFFVAFIVLTQLYMKPLGLKLLALTSEIILFLTRVLKPITFPLGRVFDRYLAEEPVTLTRADLGKLLKEVEPEDTDISRDELRIMGHALTFGDKVVHDIMTPYKDVASVSINETISPVVLDELHGSGHSRFPVTSEDGKQTVGILYMHDLHDVKGHSTVKEVMRKHVYFVNEDRELEHVLQAFRRTKQHLFIVVNTAAEPVGVIAIEDVVEQILGQPISDDFDHYDNMEEVAAARAKEQNTKDDESVVE